MDLELHQLDTRYAALRTKSPTRERQLVASLAELGQQQPIVVVAGQSAERYVVIDGYKRLRALQKLGRDTVRATPWQLDEAEALMLERLMRTSEADSALEQGWLLKELRTHFGLSFDELARRFDKSKSWVSRRVALVEALPELVQARVREGAIGAHAAMKHLVPLARANACDCHALVTALSGLRLSTRQLGALCAAYTTAPPEVRARILSDPGLFLRAHAAASGPPEQSPAQLLLGDLGALSGLARRCARRLSDGLAARLSPDERALTWRCAQQGRADTQTLFALTDKELRNARPEHTHGHSAAS
ncbi:MAG: nuclease [Limisphaerales bacterium]|nr:MAG: nuclease [Limisphaerales bacterium]